MESAEGGELRTNPDGAPGIFIYDESRPLHGLEAFGFGPANELKDLFEGAASLPDSTDTPLDHGDIIVVQARPDEPHAGGSTMLGKCRRAFHIAATKSESKFAKPNPQDRFLWITDFPMFTPNNSHDGPNDQGASGFSATHHPFTAPKSAADVDLLLTNPLRAVADHYDLVLNGVELGGGSRRIHNSEMQQYVMKDILKVRSLTLV
jgi:aspartyl-tRNA synthetase